MKTFKYLLILLVGMTIGQVIDLVAMFPYPGGEPEQVWLDSAIEYLKEVRNECPRDCLLRERLTYTIEKYNKVGVFGVSFCDISSIGLAGYNNPYIPGMVVNVRLLDMPIKYGAGIVLHEALHDYFPCYGHAHVTPVMLQYQAVSNIVELKRSLNEIQKDSIRKNTKEKAS